MRFPKKNRTRYSIAPPLISLVDIVLLLLIYFLLTSDYVVRDGLEVTLPQAQTATAGETEAVVVSIDDQGHLALGGREMSLAALAEAVAELLNQTPERTVIISSDKDVDLGTAVSVMDSLRGAGATRLLLETERLVPSGGG